MPISKVTGAIIALVFMYFVYIDNYRDFVSETIYANELLMFFSLGTLSLFFVKIEPNTKAEVTFWGSATGVFWGDGYCLMPTPFPTLDSLDIHFFWWLEKPITEKEYFRHTERNATHHYQDQRDPRFNINVQTSLLTAQTTRITGNILSWFFMFWKGDKELMYQRLGIRIIFIAIVLGYGANTFFPKNEDAAPSWMKFFTALGQNNSNGNEESTKTIPVSIQLAAADEDLPAIPPSEFFLNGNQNHSRLSWSYTYIEGKKYFYYLHLYGGKIPVITISGGECIAIAAGKEVGFKTKKPPKWAINMKDVVRYSKKKEYLGLDKKIMEFFYLADTWFDLQYDWSTVDTSVTITGKALPLKDLKDGALGGLVCF